jgi:hypothetical protein
VSQANQWSKSAFFKLTVRRKWFYKRRMQISVNYYWLISNSMMISSIRSYFLIAKATQVKIKKAIRAHWAPFSKIKGLLNLIIISIRLMVWARKNNKNLKDAFLMRTLKIIMINYWIEMIKKGTSSIIIKKINYCINLILRACWVIKIIRWV